MITRRVLTWLFVLHSSLITHHSSLLGAEVQWRYDYAAARREATEKDRPLVIDFGTENCFWCKQLDLRTFRDPALIGLLNERFIPLKIDAQREAQLADSLRIQTYPTVVIASPDGKVLGTMEGFMEAPRFTEHLQRALAGLSNPEWMARDYQEAVKAVAASDHARAVALLRAVLEDKKERPIQVKARQLLAELEQQAAGRLARAKQLVDKGQAAEAVNTITALVRDYAGTQAAAEGGRMLTTLGAQPEVAGQPRARRAREVLAQAKEDFRTQQYLCCLDRCEVLAGAYADLPEAAEAGRLAGEIKNNPEWMKQACEGLSDRLSALYVALAESWLKKGEPLQAVLYLERVVQTFPGTRQAEAAQLRLWQIQGQPTRPVDFKNPGDGER